MAGKSTMVSNDTKTRPRSVERIESRPEVVGFLKNLKYALENNAKIIFQRERAVDKERDEKYTNDYTVADLFPEEDPVEALRRELSILTVEEYIRTVKDLRFSNRSDLREFGRVYDGKGEVYIKIRVELLASYGNHTTFVMSFHYAMYPFKESVFPYKTHK